MNERADQIKEAQKLARKLKRPWAVKPAQWAVMQRVLIELAYHVPEVRPTQAGLAEKLGTYRNAVRRALDGAEANGLIERVVHDNFHGQWDGTEYRLLWWPFHTQVSGGSNNATVAQNVVIPVAQIGPWTVAQPGPLNGGSTNPRRNEPQHSPSESVNGVGPTPPPLTKPKTSLRSRKPGKKRNRWATRCMKEPCRNSVGAGAGFIVGKKDVWCWECWHGMDPNRYVPIQDRAPKKKRTITRVVITDYDQPG